MCGKNKTIYKQNLAIHSYQVTPVFWSVAVLDNVNESGALGTSNQILCRSPLVAFTVSVQFAVKQIAEFSHHETSETLCRSLWIGWTAARQERGGRRISCVVKGGTRCPYLSWPSQTFIWGMLPYYVSTSFISGRSIIHRAQPPENHSILALCHSGLHQVYLTRIPLP